MALYFIRRLGWAVGVLLLVALATFALTYVVPADPARVIAGLRASQADVDRISHALGLDQPFLAQLGAYVLRVLRLDFGHSYVQNRDVLPLILERVPATLQLAGGGLLVSLGIGIPLGVLAAARRGSWIDRSAMILAVILVAAPSFWVGYLLINLLAFRPLMAWGIGIFPITGYAPYDLRYLALPALTLGFAGAAYYARLTRAVMLEEINRDYVRTARSKGLTERRVRWRHAFRNALGPILTQVGLDLGLFLGGVVVVERIFSWPGMGKLAVDSIVDIDIPLIMGTVLLGTLCIVFANLAVDMANAFLDPRIRH
ncbi:MAG: ABC transporter permease [Chloroflexota bacterium]|nr:ABC transporter permease [Chloroflexota bacterium]